VTKPDNNGTTSGHQFTRRDFLKAGGAVVVSALFFDALTACSAKVETVTATATKTATVTKNVTETVTATATSATRSLTDMLGRTLEVPKNIQRVLGTSPHEPIITYMLAPDKLTGLTSAMTGNFIPEKYKTLPVVGGWYSTQIGNYETFISMEPDIILKGQVEAEEGNSIDEMQTKFGSIPVVGILTGGSLTELEATIRFLSDLLDVKDSGDALIAYYKEAMHYVTGIAAQIPEENRVRVYYAEGKDGLSTDPTGSRHTELVDLCGGLNIADVTLKPGAGQAEVSLEQVLQWNPDMIIIGRGAQASVYNLITTDSKWAELKAVKDGKVYIRPSDPYSWFDGPPGANQIIGLYWTVKKLYPEQTADLDLDAKIKEFYSQFYHYDLTNDEVAQLLANPA
jgi:iron complex transport system substrate-binding protein